MFFKFKEKAIATVIFICSALWLPAAYANSGTSSQAQPAVATDAALTPARGALFRIDHNGNTTYLFGTIHVGKRTFYPLDAVVTQAFAAADKLVVEVDIGNNAALQAALTKHGMYTAPDNIRRHLPPALLEQLQRALSLDHIALDSVQQMKPWLMANLLLEVDLMRHGYLSTFGADAFLLEAARQQAKTIQQLETADYQFSLFDSLSAAEQLLYLREMLAETQAGTLLQDTEALMHAWRDADAAAQERIQRTAIEDKGFISTFTRQVLLNQRNPAMAQAIEGFLKNDKTTFVAVGLLHLLGEHSVPDLLRQRGYLVQRVH